MTVLKKIWTIRQSDVRFRNFKFHFIVLRNIAFIPCIQQNQLQQFYTNAETSLTFRENKLRTLTQLYDTHAQFQRHIKHKPRRSSTSIAIGNCSHSKRKLTDNSIFRPSVSSKEEGKKHLLIAPLLEHVCLHVHASYPQGPIHRQPHEHEPSPISEATRHLVIRVRSLSCECTPFHQPITANPPTTYSLPLQRTESPLSSSSQELFHSLQDGPLLSLSHESTPFILKRTQPLC